MVKIKQKAKNILGAIAIGAGIVALCVAAAPVVAVAVTGVALSAAAIGVLGTIGTCACAVGAAALATKSALHFSDGEVREGVITGLEALTFGLGIGAMKFGKAVIGAAASAVKAGIHIEGGEYWEAGFSALGAGLFTLSAVKLAPSSGSGSGLPPNQGQKVHGNSAQSTKPQHGYEIYNTKTGDVVKTGISGQNLNKNGTSPRANTQVNALNKATGTDQYAARIVKTDMPGRAAALDWEMSNAMRLKEAGNSMSIHARPAPWLD